VTNDKNTSRASGKTQRRKPHERRVIRIPKDAVTMFKIREKVLEGSRVDENAELRLANIMPKRYIMATAVAIMPKDGPRKVALPFGKMEFIHEKPLSPLSESSVVSSDTESSESSLSG